MVFIVVPGVLACLDGYMNIAMEQTEEYVDGVLKTKYGDAFIRGNNGKQHISSHSWWSISCTPVDIPLTCGLILSLCMV